jgi:chromosome segregation ATPase
MKEAAIRAAFRLVHTALRRKKNGGVGLEVLPFEALGDATTLVGLVSQAQRAMHALEDSEALLAEKKSLEAIVTELRVNISQLELDMEEKSRIFKDVNLHGEEAALRAKDAIAELDELSIRLKNSRNELQQVESARFLQQKEVDTYRVEIQELVSLSGLERSSLESIREKQKSARYELEQWESALSNARTIAIDEERRGREAKSSVTDKLRVLQLDASRLEATVTAKQRELEELDRIRALCEEEMEISRRDLESDKSLIAREVEVWDA